MRYLQFCSFATMFVLALQSTLGITCTIDAKNQDSKIEYKLCTTQICEEAGNEIIKSFDQSVEPCDNFYKHACGGWLSNHFKSEMLKVYSQRDVLEMKSLTQLKDLLEEMLEKNETSENETLRKVADYYKSCKNMAAIDARGLTPIESIVLANGGWPLTLPANNWTLEDHNLTLQEIHKNYAAVASRSALFVIKVLPDRLNSRTNLLHWIRPMWFSETPMYRQRSFVPRKKKRESLDLDYIRYTEAVANELALLRGLNVSSANIEDDVEEMLHFRESLNELYSTVSKEEFDKGTYYRVTTIGEVQNTWNAAISGRPEYAINWLESIRSALNGTGIVIDATEKIVLARKNIVERLADLLKNTPLRTVVNYVHWHAIDALVSYALRYENNDDQRSMFCTDNHVMREGLSFAYVRKYFDENITLMTVKEMVSQIQAEIKRQFDQSTWMDDEAKFRSKEKVDNMLKNIGYPSWYDEPGKIDEYYSDLAIGPNYFENMVNFNRFRRIASLKKLREPYDRHKIEWALLPITVNAVYTSDLNAITIPAVHFQMPTFHAKRPWVMNYGSLGVVIGHEISHGFDKIGVMYDEEGNKKQWWSTSTIIRYNEKAKCFIDQYSNYTLTDNYMNVTIKIDGEQTLAENIADNTGITVALRAYLSYKKEHNLMDVRIPELKNYSDEKLFFYALANRFCASEERNIAANYWNYRSIPSSLRLNWVISNMREFSKAFNCPTGSPMNPAKKCSLLD